MTRPSPARQRQQERKRALAARRGRLSLENPPPGALMSVDDLAELADISRHLAYKAVQDGVYPAIRAGNGTIGVLTAPTLEILRGQRPPGSKPLEKKHRRRPAKRSTATKKQKPILKGEVAPAVLR